MNDRNPPVRDTTGAYSFGGSGGGGDDDRFLGDPLLPAFYREEQDTYFSLGLVVNWATTSIPSSQSYNVTNYERFLSAVKTECFRGRKNDIPFFLPFHALHITVASLFQACKLSQLPLSRQHAEPSIEDADATAGGTVTTKQHTDNNNSISDSVVVGDDGAQRRLALATEWKKVLLRASSSDDWPKRPLKLELDSAQIRNRAGIFLWKEHTGGIAKIRRCLEVAAKDEEAFSSRSMSVLRERLKIPDIIHTTFVRYHNHHHRDEGTEKSPDTTTTGGDDDDDEAMLLRPSQAHSILIERVVPNQALFSKTGSNSVKDDDGDDDNHPPCETGSTNDSTNGAKIERVVAVDVASLVDCKIYLLDPGKEKDHEVFLSLPLQDSTKA